MTANPDAQALQSFLGPLFADLEGTPQFYDQKPLLAHYTSIGALEAILRNNELWFSNPLYMNDLEEVRFGINEGVNAFLSSSTLEDACGTKERAALLRHNFSFYHQRFDSEHVIDTYVFCLSEHDPADHDGMLSMWRGYGANGNGAAIVFDTGKLVPRDGTPLIIARVDYASTDDRRKWIADKIDNLARILSSTSIPDDKLSFPALAFFERLKTFAIFSKHPGFREEREWRAVYKPELDLQKAFTHMIDYAVTSRGIEPKLKFKVQPLPGFIEDDVSLEKVIHRIILGPTISSPLAQASVAKMLDHIAPVLKTHVVASSIPFRAG
ncbi:MAG: DUF2971 domain-containing protein [Alphaproteobacteria bacterium]|nr:DUF2971 domain-containing protein [Alphaproteobacteria bacterium]